jgi:hypothetical protein
MPGRHAGAGSAVTSRFALICANLLAGCILVVRFAATSKLRGDDGLRTCGEFLMNLK